jgi:hypothetical protein
LPPKSSEKTKSVKAYDANKERARERIRKLTLAGQDIGSLPPIADLERRIRGEQSFRLFCEIYFPHLFTLAWSEDHLRVIGKIETVVTMYDTLAVAMPRGSGKTTLSLVAVIWAILTGRHPFVYLLAAADDTAKRLLDNIKNQLSSNRLLLEDFPEALYPIHRLENEARRCNGQKYLGRPTNIKWGADELVMPTIPNSKCSGAVIRVSGLTGNFRGAMHIRPNGQSIRPTLVIADDPQTDSTARSMVQTAERLAILNGTIIGLAGPGKRTGVIVPCTVIYEGDLADQLLDRNRFPAWRGERTKLVYEWPENMKLWGEYAKLREDSLRTDGRGEEATAFYMQNREEMDRGAKVAWPDRYSRERGEISALQSAYNLLMDYGEHAFASEFQNEPLRPGDNDEVLKPEDIWKKVNGRNRGEVPLECRKLTAFIDVHDNLLYYCVCGWEEGFTGYVIEYGTYPKQNRRHFSLHNVSKTLKTVYPEAGVDGAIMAGLEELVKRLLDKKYRRGEGLMQIDRLFVDMGYKDKIVAAVKFKVGGSTMMLSKGVGIRAGSKPISSYRRKPGWKIGHNWYIPSVAGTQEFPHISIDTNFWKSFVHDRFATKQGDPGCLTLYGEPSMHELFSEHIAASETWTLTHGQGRDVREWKVKPSRPDNHWFDCLVGCAAAASEQGIWLEGQEVVESKRKKPRIRLSDLQRQRRAL